MSRRNILLIVTIALLFVVPEISYAVHSKYRGDRPINADRKWIDITGTYYVYQQGGMLYVPKGPFKGFWHPSKDDPTRWFGNNGTIILKDGQLHMPDSQIYFPTH